MIRFLDSLANFGGRKNKLLTNLQINPRTKLLINLIRIFVIVIRNLVGIATFLVAIKKAGGSQLWVPPVVVLLTYQRFCTAFSHNVGPSLNRDKEP